MALSTLPAITKYRFTVAEYDQMIEIGLFSEGKRVELIDGEIVQMAPMGNRHASHIGRCTMLFTDRLRDVCIVTVQTPLVLSEHSEPEPDLMLLRPRSDFYAGALPTPADVLLLIEMSDSTFSYDQNVKIPLYARDGIPEVWQFDLDAARINTFRDPSPRGYRTIRTLHLGDSMAPLAFPAREIAVADLLG